MNGGLQEMTHTGRVGCPGGQSQYRKYNIAKRNLQSGLAQVPIGNNVNGFVVKNSGNTIVLFNNEPLNPGESQSVGGNEGEIFDGRVDIYFRPSVPVVIPTINSCWITVKYFV